MVIESLCFVGEVLILCGLVFKVLLVYIFNMFFKLMINELGIGGILIYELFLVFICRLLILFCRRIVKIL